MSTLRPAVFLDKDGTLLVDVPFNANPASIRFAPSVPAALKVLGALDHPLFVVTNQPGIARGLLSEEDMAIIHGELRSRFATCGAELAGYYFCPHEAPAQDGAPRCECRKPRAGMLRKAAADHGLDLASSWMVGDILDDVEAGRRAGCLTIFVDRGNETEWKLAPERMPHVRVRNMLAAATVIASRRGNARARSSELGCSA